MKHKTAAGAIDEFIRLRPKMFSYLADDNSEHKMAKSVKTCCSNNNS